MSSREIYRIIGEQERGRVGCFMASHDVSRRPHSEARLRLTRIVRHGREVAAMAHCECFQLAPEQPCTGRCSRAAARSNIAPTHEPQPHHPQVSHANPIRWHKTNPSLALSMLHFLRLVILCPRRFSRALCNCYLVLSC